MNLNSMMVGTAQAKVMEDFYQKVFGRAPDMKEEGWAGWKVGSSFFSVGQHSEVKGSAKEPPRMMFVFETKEVKEEFDRIVKLGGVAVKAPYDMEGMQIATIADPDGNYFQLMSPWESK